MDEFWTKVEKTLRYHGQQLVRAFRSLRWDRGELFAQQPVFIVGCSRAGTTLVYKTFSESRVLGSLQRETHDFWAELHPLSERNWNSHGIEVERACDHDRKFVSRSFFTHTGKRRFADKNNQNGLSVPYLRALFPDAYFVYVKRSAGDNINSLIEGWRRADEFASWSDHLPARVAIDDGRFKRWCFFLADGWREYTRASIEEVCAFQYRAMNEAILQAKVDVPPEQWCEIFYEDLLVDPVEGFAQAFAQCGLPFDERMRRHCATVLSRPYNAFSEIRRDKWRDGPHRECIERILPEVAAVAHRMGYDD